MTALPVSCFEMAKLHDQNGVDGPDVVLIVVTMGQRICACHALS